MMILQVNMVNTECSFALGCLLQAAALVGGCANQRTHAGRFGNDPGSLRPLTTETVSFQIHGFAKTKSGAT